MPLVVSTPPAQEPIDTSLVKAHLNLVRDDEEDYLTHLIKCAREHTETYINRALLTQTLKLVRDDFPNNRVIELERSPVQSVTSVQYTDSDGNEQTFADTNYTTSLNSMPGRVILDVGRAWPTPKDSGEVVWVNYVAGYTLKTLIPTPIIQGMMTLIAHWYANRETVAIVQGIASVDVPDTFKHLVIPYRVWSKC